MILIILNLLIVIVFSTALDVSDSVHKGIELCFLGGFIVEMFLKIVGYSLKEYLHDNWNRFDGGLVLISLIVNILEAVLLMNSGISNVASNGRIVRIFSVLKLARTIRVFTVVPKLKVLTKTFVAMSPMLICVMTLMYIVGFIWSIMGMEIFGNTQLFEGSADCHPWCPSFSTFSQAQLTMFQIASGNAWSEIMYSSMQAHDTKWAAAFYVIYLVTNHIILLNLLGALVLEVFALEMDKVEQEDMIVNKMFSVSQDGKELQDGQELPPEEMQENLDLMGDSIKKMFDKVDEDGSGLLSTSEIHKLLEESGGHVVAKHEIDNVLATLDDDGDGMMDFIEFKKWWVEQGTKHLFEKFDVDNNGWINPDEFQQMSTSLGVALSEEDLKTALQFLDADGNGKISLSEYLKWWQRFEVQQAFDKLDVDKSGDIDRGEFRKLVQSLGLDLNGRELKRAIQALDKNNDGTICYAEFEPWWLAQMNNGNTKRNKKKRGKNHHWQEDVFLKEKNIHTKIRMETLKWLLERHPVTTEEGSVKTAEVLHEEMCQRSSQVDWDKHNIKNTVITKDGKKVKVLLAILQCIWHLCNMF